MDTLKKLAHLEEVGKRLRAMASVRGLPAPHKDQLTAEADTLEWAFTSLKQEHFQIAVCVAGQEEFLYEVLEPSNIFLVTKGVAFSVLFEPPVDAQERIHTSLLGKSKWPGDKLADGKTPHWLHCERYFAARVEGHPEKKAVLLYCLIDKPWLTETGTNKAKLLVSNWVDQVYNALSWTKAQPTE